MPSCALRSAPCALKQRRVNGWRLAGIVALVRAALARQQADRRLCQTVYCGFRASFSVLREFSRALLQNPSLLLIAKVMNVPGILWHRGLLVLGQNRWCKY